MSYSIAIQKTIRDSTIPTAKKLQQWAMHALKTQLKTAEICLRIVNEKESEELNRVYRHKSYATNVLSFPVEEMPGIQLKKPYLGDLVLCSAVIKREAQQQKKILDAHWAHLVIHGVLHLLGYDHIAPHQAHEMEELEIYLLQQLGYDNPYGDEVDD